MHLDKEMILKELSKISLPTEKYWVVMGAALVLYGIKKTTKDIDIGCDLELFNHLIEQGYELKLSNSGKKKITIKENINIYCEWDVEGIVLIDSIPVADLKSIINDKQKLGRDKDLEDINIINGFLGKGLYNND